MTEQKNRSIPEKPVPSISPRPIVCRVTIYIAAADRRPVAIRPLYRAPITFVEFFPNLTKYVPIIDVIMQDAAMAIGYKAKEPTFENKIEPRTIVAAIVTTYVSNKSAAIPAQSPTLSPTLSAIVAGFLGSSSGIPASTLPTRSPPTSAPLVNIPPPSLANTEISEAPSERETKPSITPRESAPIGPVKTM